jgi:hypothetical protein
MKMIIRRIPVVALVVGGAVVFATSASAETGAQVVAQSTGPTQPGAPAPAQPGTLRPPPTATTPVQPAPVKPVSPTPVRPAPAPNAVAPIVDPAKQIPPEVVAPPDKSVVNRCANMPSTTERDACMKRLQAQGKR